MRKKAGEGIVIKYSGAKNNQQVKRTRQTPSKREVHNWTLSWGNPLTEILLLTPEERGTGKRRGSCQSPGGEKKKKISKLSSARANGKRYHARETAALSKRARGTARRGDKENTRGVERKKRRKKEKKKKSA